MNSKILVILFCALAVGCSESKPHTQEVAGFHALSEQKSKTLFFFDLDKMNTDLVWTVWLEKVNGSLYPSLQSGLPSESLIVYFQMSSDRQFVHLFQKNQNEKDPRGPELINRFPVVSQSDSRVVFDFSKGLTKYFFTLFFDPTNTTEFDFDYSSVSDFENSENVVTFSQMAKLRDSKSSTLIMHHAFRLLEDGSGFVANKIVKPATLGLFPASFSVDPNSTEPVTIRKWDMRKPVKFYISSNTPSELVSSVLEGFEWWNKALGFKFFQVEVLKEKVNWGDARINIFQWSEDDSVCAISIAVGPSEANPVTGQIYSGKVILCGNKLLSLFDKGIVPGTIPREEFNKKVVTWATAHELGHALGFDHNFAGKLYRDPEHPEILNSTVMDYPVPEEIPAYNGVGPADQAKLDVAYLNKGNKALETLRSFPYCNDEDAEVKPDCTRFVRSGLTPSELSYRYLQLLKTGKPFPEVEHRARHVTIKQFFVVGDQNAISNAKELFGLSDIAQPDSLFSDLERLSQSTKAKFNSLPSQRKRAVFDAISECVLNCSITFENQKKPLSVLGKSQAYEGYQSLVELKDGIFRLVQTEKDPDKLKNYYQTYETAKSYIENFWP